MYDATKEQVEQWKDIRLQTMPLLRYATRKPHVELHKRYALLVCVCLKDDLTVELFSFTNTEIKNKWFQICEEFGISQWCYYDDFLYAVRPNFEEKFVKPNEHPRDEERRINFLKNRSFGR